MLLPEHFDREDELPPFEIPVDNLQLGSHGTGPVKIPVYYDGDWSLVFQLGAFVSHREAFAEDFSPTFRVRGANEDTKLIVTLKQFSSDLSAVNVEARPQREPLVLQFSEKAQLVRGVLLSPPKFIQKAITLREEGSIFHELAPFRTQSSTACLVTSNLNSDAKAPMKPLSNLIDFLTFMKGSHCGVGNLVAFDNEGEVAYNLFGFTKNDAGKRETNWFDIEIQEHLPVIFNLFSSAMSNPVTRRALRQTISFYRASNASRAVSIEMAIIAAHSALEAIVNYTLHVRAGWSVRLLDERAIRFSDKMRAAAAYFDLHEGVLDHSPALTDLSRQRNNIDAYDLISFIRNKLVHQDAKFVPTGLQLHEAWSIAQWLVEVLLFGVIGYQGEVIERRIYNGWRGTTARLPIRCK